MKSLHAAIVRNATGLEQLLVLAKAGLRPGIDTAQFQSALAQAEIDLLQTERTWQQKMTELGRLTVTSNADTIIILTDTVFNSPAGLLPDTVYNASAHPYYQAVAAQKSVTAAGLKEVQKLWVPQLDVWGSLYARGSGVDAAGSINKTGGLNLARTNAGIGLQLSFPVLQYSKVNIQKKQYQQLLKADDAKLSQAQLDINRQAVTAIQQYHQDMKIAARSPSLLKSATDVYDALKLSYETGLIDYTRLAQSQYELLRAEVNDANARLQVWRSLLAVSVAKGNLNLFTDQLK